MFGIYVVLGGADSVGGGFQGGAVLSATIMLVYFIDSTKQSNTHFLQTIEKMFMVMLLMLVMLLLGRSMIMPGIAGRIWMILLNTIIGVKVGCGLSIILIRYFFYER